MADEDPINPDHYRGLLPEPITVIESWGLGYLLGTVVKYLSRAGRKTPDARLDLRKARWFLDREIARLEDQYKPEAERQMPPQPPVLNWRRNPPTFIGQTEFYDGVDWVGSYAAGIYYWVVA